MDIKKRIGFVSYGRKKRALLDWVENNTRKLRPHDLYATGLMGELMTMKSGLPVNRLNSKRLGGDQQLVDLMASGQLDILFMFWDAVTPTHQDVKVRTLLRLAIMYNVVVACNAATADFILTSTAMEQTYQPPTNHPDGSAPNSVMVEPLYSDVG